MLIEGQFQINAAPEVLMRHFLDAKLMAACVPGCESLEIVDADSYRTVLLVAMAGIKARFNLLVTVTDRDERSICTMTRGEEGGQASRLQAESRITLAEASGGTLVSYRSEVSVTGRLGRFALGMMKKKAQNIGEEFAANLRSKLEELGAGNPRIPAGD